MVPHFTDFVREIPNCDQEHSPLSGWMKRAKVESGNAGGNDGHGGRMEEREKQLEKVRTAIEELPDSPLVEERRRQGYSPVTGEGNPYARIMLVGEAPGEREARTGKPFVGASGKVLDELLDSTGLRREDVYITNVVKDRPPGNRDPGRAEIEAYRPFLARQLEIIRPEVIVTLGRFAMDFILEHFAFPQAGSKIGELHGRLLKGSAPYGPVYVLPLYHPAVALYNREQRETLEKDFQALKPFVEKKNAGF